MIRQSQSPPQTQTKPLMSNAVLSPHEGGDGDGFEVVGVRVAGAQLGGAPRVRAHEGVRRSDSVGSHGGRHRGSD